MKDKIEKTIARLNELGYENFSMPSDEKIKEGWRYALRKYGRRWDGQSYSMPNIWVYGVAKIKEMPENKDHWYNKPEFKGVEVVLAEPLECDRSFGDFFFIIASNDLDANENPIIKGEDLEFIEIFRPKLN